MRYVTSTILLLLLLTASAMAQGGATPGVLKTDAQKRAWLAARVRAQVFDPGRRQLLLTQLQTMPIDELDLAIENYMVKSQLQQRMAYARQAEMMPYGYQGQNIIGYQPVITTLPTGTSLNAGGVISPDGRSVRVSPQPFFSGVGPVQMFNYNTGQSGYYQPQVYQGQGRQYQGQQPQAQPQVETYYDGVRTRTRVKQ